MITPIKVFSGDNIDIIDAKYCQELTTHGVDLNFGDKDERKDATEIMAIIQLYGQAIDDVLAGKTPKRFPWAGEKVKVLQESFQEMAQDTSHEYNYPMLMACQIGANPQEGYDNVIYRDQMAIVREHLRRYLNDGVISNRIVGNIYNPAYYKHRAMPCFQWFQVRLLNDGTISLRILFRSHDYGSAVWANICAIVYWFYQQCLLGWDTELKISEVIVISTSAHVYDYDMDGVKKACSQFGDSNSVAARFM